MPDGAAPGGAVDEDEGWGGGTADACPANGELVGCAFVSEGLVEVEGVSHDRVSMWNWHRAEREVARFV